MKKPIMNIHETRQEKRRRNGALRASSSSPTIHLVDLMLLSETGDERNNFIGWFFDVSGRKLALITGKTSQNFPEG